MKNKQTVLIVDDIADNLNIVTNILMQENINVILAQSGKEAIKSVNNFKPDLILLDIMMPGLNGFDVCKILKEDNSTKDIPVIFLTAINNTNDIVKGFEYGIVDYISKPFIAKELVSRVKTHLKIYIQHKELQKKEKQIKENEEKLRTIYNNANEGIFVLQDNYIVFMNKKLCQIAGYSEQIIKKNTFTEFIHDGDKKNVTEYHKKKLNGEKIGKAIIFRLISHNNKIKYVKINSKQINWNGKQAILGMLDDITESYLLQEELKKSRNRLKCSQKVGNIGTLEWTFKDDKIRCSEITFQICGITKPIPYINTKELFNYIHKKDKKRIIKNFIYITKNKTTKHKSTYRILKNEKEIRWIEETSEIIYDKKGLPLKMTSIIQDITERKNAEEELKAKNDEIKSNHEEILSSIRYAQTIQKSLLPKQSKLNKILKNNFIFYKPKDIVSGDFYYVNKIKNNIVFSIADCTGHGVPGGFLTMLGIKSLHEIIKEKKIRNPAKILIKLRKIVIDIFKDSEKTNFNGIDLAFCKINLKTNILQYAGAYIPLWIIRNNKLIEIKATRNPIGYFPIEKDFENHEIKLQNNDKIYLFTDGFKDQIGGPNMKKYSNTPFKKLILKISKLPINKQKDILENELKKWQGNYIQVDDITILGIEWKT